MAIQIQFRRGLASEWTSANPTLAVGEMGIETDTNQFKIGTGSAAWASLGYAPLAGATNASQVATTVSTIATAHTITAADENTFVRSTSATAVTMTIANVLNIGESVQFIQFGAGQITFAAGSGVALRSVDNRLKSNKQYSVVAITCVASGEYLVTGDVVA